MSQTWKATMLFSDTAPPTATPSVAAEPLRVASKPPGEPEARKYPNPKSGRMKNPRCLWRASATCTPGSAFAGAGSSFAFAAAEVIASTATTIRRRASMRSPGVHRAAPLRPHPDGDWNAAALREWAEGIGPVTRRGPGRLSSQGRDDEADSEMGHANRSRVRDPRHADQRVRGQHRTLGQVAVGRGDVGGLTAAS